jgi:diguanylate cyclase (GGDEF)-like protein
MRNKFTGFLSTLKGFVFTAIVSVAALVFLGATFASSLLYEHLLEARNLDTSREIASENFDSVYQVLRRGGSHQEVIDAARATKLSFVTTVDSITVLPAPNAGHATLAPAPALPAAASGALAASPNTPSSKPQSVVARAGARVHYTYALSAGPECLACHANAQLGELLGAVEIRHNLQTVTATARLYYVGLFLVLGLLVLLFALALMSITGTRLNRSVVLFRDKVGAFSSIKDFNQFDLSKVDFGFQEFNQTFDHVAVLVDKIKAIAVDKDVLEFEIKLLEKFIITSDVVRDWREFINSLLIEINPIIDAYALVTVFRTEDEAYECEIFWRNPPSAHVVGLFEKILRKQLHGHPFFDGVSAFKIKHNIADNQGTLPELSYEDIELQTKTLLLDTPKIGGIVGIGVQSTLEECSVRHMVIASILSTLLNLVGSVKAIYKYTKDLEHYVTRDPLTDLYNQRMFWELLGYEVGRSKRHKQPFGVLMLDLDNFKSFNDRYGHHCGDALLQGFAKVLQDAVRDGDVLARYGGDEFCVILPEASAMQAHMIAQRIGEMIASFSMQAPDGVTIRTTTSIGIAMYPLHGDNPKDLFLVADNMMYKAKRSGKNAIAIPSDDEMAEVFRKAGEKAIMIQNALDQKKIVPYFQPICKCDTGEIVIHELLMRIELGDEVVVANDFIEEAESMGIAHKMDYQLIEKAFIEIERQGYQGILFVNLSPKALIVGEFAARVSELAHQFGIAPQRIVFEITERETVRNLTLLEKFVRDVKLQGFSFAIDDFGSGYSSFQYIKRFPVDYIKIEGEFIRNMLHDEIYLAFVKSIVTLAKELRIKTVAEFVEDADILAAVTDLGIDYAQGYHISRPAPTMHLAAAPLLAHQGAQS